MAKKKELHKIKSSMFARSVSLAKVGLHAGAKAASTGMSNFFSEEKAAGIRSAANTISQMAILAEELGKLKGSVMKVGQMLSIYGEHFLPPEANRLLKTLQSDSPPLAWPEIQKCLNRSLGKELVSKLDIEQTALAAASLGQVHRARIRSSGKEIVLKVQYPGVDEAIESDIRALKTLLYFTKILPKIPDTEMIFREIKAMLEQEVDYHQEYRMLEFFHGELAGNPHFLIPQPLAQFSAKRVLAMDYLPGIPIDSVEVQNLSQERRNSLATTMLDFYFRELYHYRKVQTDPHFGNYRIQLRANSQENDKWVLYDYGAVREFSEVFIRGHREMLTGIILNDRERFETSACALKVLNEGDPQELKNCFHDLCSLILEPFLKDELYLWGETDLPARVSEKTLYLLKNFKLRSPPREVVFLDRKMIGIFTCLAVLRPKINGRRLLLKHLEN